MSHITVGERLIGQAPEILGHIIVGAGHFIEQGAGIIQQFSRTGNIIPVIASNRFPDLSNPIAANQWQWDTLQSNYGSGSLLANAEVESRAAEKALLDSIEMSFENKMDATKDFVLAVGSAMAGDLEGSAQYSASAVEKYTTGFLKDMGFNGGWGTGPTPGQGTCPPGPDNGR